MYQDGARRWEIRPDEGEFAQYRAWLRANWGVTLDGRGAVFEPTHDPRDGWSRPFRALGLAEATDRSRGVGSDFITWFVAKALLRDPDAVRGREVWEMGCGAGILSALCARLGARRVRASDLNPVAVGLTRRTAAWNGVEVETAVCPLFDGIPWRSRPEVLLADLPQKPVQGVRYPLNEDGGLEGTRILAPFLEEARRRLAPQGRLFFFLHALPHPLAMVRLHRLFRPRLISVMWQIFARQTLWEILPYLRARREAGICWFRDLPDGRFAYPVMLFDSRI